MAKHNVGLELGKVQKVFGNLWDILVNLGKSSAMVKSSSEILILPEQKSNARMLEKVGRFIIILSGSVSSFTFLFDLVFGSYNSKKIS